MNLFPDRTINHVAEHFYCRVCGSALEVVLDLGPMELNYFPATRGDTIGPRVPLTLAQCTSNPCRLVQLTRTVPPAWMYREHYWYRSGVNEMMVEHLRRIVASVVRMVPLRATDHVLDIGANDGTLLKLYGEWKVPARRVAVEPALNLQHTLAENAFPDLQVSGFFPDCLDELPSRFKVITSIAMFYDVDDPDAFVRAIKTILAPDGVWILEVGYLPWMLNRRAFDSICHEHLEYYSLRSLDFLLSRHGLKILDVYLNDTNGASMQVVVTHRRFPSDVSGFPGADARVLEAKMREDDSPERFERFRQDVESVKRRVLDHLDMLERNTKSCDLYGASTKGNTLLQYFEVGEDNFAVAYERSEEKFGRYTVAGTDVPIHSDAVLLEKPPDVLLCPIWHFKPAVIARETAFLEQGGTFLFPLPEVTIVTGPRNL